MAGLALLGASICLAAVAVWRVSELGSEVLAAETASDALRATLDDERSDTLAARTAALAHQEDALLARTGEAAAVAELVGEREARQRLEAGLALEGLRHLGRRLVRAVVGADPQ